MSLISGFCNQAAELKRLKSAGSSDGYEEAEYHPPETIKVRKETKRGLVRTALGSEVQAETYVLTEEEIIVGDLIDGIEVRRIETIDAKNGALLGFEAYL